jgi:hypothetical protein
MFIPDPGSKFIPLRSSDPNFFYPRSAAKNLGILSSRKYDPGIADPDPDFLSIPDPGVKKAQDPGSATLLRPADFVSF